MNKNINTKLPHTRGMTPVLGRTWAHLRSRAEHLLSSESWLKSNEKVTVRRVRETIRVLQCDVDEIPDDGDLNPFCVSK